MKASREINNEYRTFLRCHIGVCKFGLDNVPDQATLLDDFGEPAKPCVIPEDEFLRRIYVPRPKTEALIKRYIAMRDDLLCLIGGAGAGKTTLARKLQRDLQGSLDSRTFICHVDLRDLMRGNESLAKSQEPFIRFVSKQVREHYIRNLFKATPGKSSQDGLTELYAYLLDPDADPARPDGLFSRLFAYQDRAEILFDSVKVGGDYDNKSSYAKWIKGELPRSIELRTLLKELRRDLIVPHLVYAARSIRKVERQVVWFDNVDALDNDIQLQIFRHAKVFQRQITGLGSTVVTIRDENVKHFEQERGAPIFTTRVRFSGQAEQPAFDYPSIEMPVASEATLRSLTRERLEYTRRFQSKKVTELLKEIDHHTTLANEAATVEEEQRLLARRSEQETELSYYTPLISRRRYSALCRISERLMSAMGAELVIYLANNSIRELLFMHRDCLAKLLLLGESDDGMPLAANCDDWYIQTLFLAWIRTTERTYKKEIHDIFESSREWHQSPGDTVGCTLPYLVINTVRNLRREKRGLDSANYPSVKEVVDRLALLGFREPQVMGQIRRHLLEINLFCRSQHSLVPSELEDTDTVSVTLKGRCLTGVTYNSFGYIYECMSRVLSSGETLNAAESFKLVYDSFSVDTDTANGLMIPHLCDIVTMHLRELVRIRDTGHFGEINWLRKYLLWFGLPAVRPFVRKASGRIISGVPRGLQVEMLLQSLLAYVPKTSPSYHSLEKLFHCYQRDLEDISVYRTPGHGLNMRKALGIAERKLIEENKPWKKMIGNSTENLDES